MMSWTRQTPLDGLPRSPTEELWTYDAGDGREPLACPMRVRVGKPLDVLGLKGTDLSDVRDYATGLSETARRLYGSGDGRPIAACPACRTSTEQAVEGLSVFGISYRRCRACGHAFVGKQPGTEALSAVFAASESLSATYTDLDAAERRIRDIVMPKLSWVTDLYASRLGRPPASGVDVGAGGGHFVAGARRHGLAAQGFEISASSRAFARAAFDLALRDDDFLSAPPEPVDVVTLWGLLEYTPEPRRFLEAARRWLRPDAGLLIVEVPRYDAVSTVVQASPTSWVARHMDPTSHVNCFSDASLATALVETGYRPVAAWYFGLDAYELLVQAALRLGDDGAFDRLADLIPALQQAFDQGRQCDDLIIAAVPTPVP